MTDVQEQHQGGESMALTCHCISHRDLGVSGFSVGINIPRCIQWTVTLLWYQAWDVQGLWLCVRIWAWSIVSPASCVLVQVSCLIILSVVFWSWSVPVFESWLLGFPVTWCHAGNLKSAMVGLLAPWKFTDFRSGLLSPRKLVVKLLLAHHYVYLSFGNSVMLWINSFFNSLIPAHPPCSHSSCPS